MKKLLFLWALLISTVLQVNAQTWTWVGEVWKDASTKYYLRQATGDRFITGDNKIVNDINSAALWTISGTSDATIQAIDGQKIHNENQTWTLNGAIINGSQAYSFTTQVRVVFSTNTYYVYISNVSVNTTASNDTASDTKNWYLISEAQRSAYNNYMVAYNRANILNPSAITDDLKSADYSNSANKTAKLNNIADLASRSSKKFANPIIPVDAADPTVILADDGYFYMCCSEHYSGEGMPLWRSADMINWTKITNIFAQRPADVTYTYLWAPEIAKVGDKYVLYYANAEWGDQEKTQICVATSDNPWGPYENNKILIRAKDSNFGAFNANVNNVIDPSYFKDDNGKQYLIWGSFNGIFSVELNAEGTGIVSSQKKTILQKNSNNNDREDNAEAASVYKRNGYYYLLTSVGSTVLSNTDNNAYHINVARSSNNTSTFDNVTFVNQDNRNVNSNSGTTYYHCEGLLSSNDYVYAPGHCSNIIKDGNGDEWVFYHGYAKVNGNWDWKTGRVLFACKVVWDGKPQGWLPDGWPGIMPPSADPQDMPVISKKAMESQLASAFQISNATDLEEFAQEVNNGNPFLNAVLTADIDCSGITSWTPIANSESVKYKGIFDGQNHRIKNLTASGSNDVALVGVVDGGAEFKNIIIDKSCSFSGVSQVAGFVGHAKGSGTLTFINCGNEATVTATDANASGFLGYTSGISTYWTNCYNAGDIKGGKESAAFSGWCGDHLLNCWNSGKVGGADGDENNKLSLTRGDITQGYANTYELNSSNASVTGMPEGYTPEWLADGRLAYYMNQTGGEAVWTQKVDNVYGDEREGHPTFGSKEVIKSGNIYHNEMYYTRDIKEGTYGTICLPYASGSIEGADIYEVAGVRKNASGEISSMVVEQVEGQLVAGKPYLFRATCTGNGRDGLYIEYTGSPVIETVDNTGMVGNLTMDKYLIPDGNYFLRTLSTGESVLTLTGESIKANVGSCRAYFSLGDVDDYDPSTASQAKTLVFGLEGVEDDADAIEALNAETTHDSYYNMMGQRVNANAKGLLIKNGKKYLNK